MGRRKRRIVRTFDFGRILTFAVVVCFAVAVTAVLLSVKIKPDTVSLKQRTLYAVSVATCDTVSEASALSSDCRRRGGAGYAYDGSGKIHIIAAIYETEGDAEKVASVTSGSSVVELTTERLQLKKAESSAKYIETLSFCLYTLPDALNKCASELDRRETSEAAALKTCAALHDGIKEIIDGFVGGGCLFSEIRALLETTKGFVKDIESGDGMLSARIRYAHCAAVVAAKEKLASLERSSVENFVD